jgi:branched-chain amino acid transport system ATP-binding protein
MSLLHASEIGKNFGSLRALDDMFIEINAGERVGLIGPNGAGKTTFFNCLLGVLKPDTGVITFDGREVNDLPVYKRARLGFGRTFQRIELFSGLTVREHLIVAERSRNGRGSFLRDVLWQGGPSKTELAACDEVIDLLGLGEFAHEPVDSLSLGKGRLVEIARALMVQPKLLLLDEPSSGLDVQETEAFADALLRIQAERNFAVLLVEHDVELVSSFTQRAYLMDLGQYITHGNTSDVMKSDELRRAYLGEGEGAGK